MYTIGLFHNGEPLILDEKTRRIHCALIGATGTGKSSLLVNLMHEDIKAGRGFALIDPHGDLAEMVASLVPKERVNDVVYFDPSDSDYAVGYNPIGSDIDASVLTSHTVSAFKHIWHDSWGPRMEYILGNAIRLLVANNLTLVSLPLILTDTGYRRTLLRNCDDPIIRLFWEQEYDKYSEKLRTEAIAPIQNKIGQFTSNPRIRTIIGQNSTFSIPDVMNNNKMFIANLSKRIGEEPSRLLGAFLVTAFAQAAESRATIPEEKRKDFTLYVDEFQNFATETFATILSEMRKWRLNLVVANQFMGQVPDVLRQSILGNVGTLAVFRIGAEDAPMIAGQLEFPNPLHLTSTPNYHAWVKTTLEGSPGEPHMVSTLPPPARGDSLDAVRAVARNRHSRLRVDVEASIANLFDVSQKRYR